MQEGPRGDGGAAVSRPRGSEALVHGPPPVMNVARSGWPCASHVHVHGASRGTLALRALGGLGNAGMTGKGSRGRARAPIDCARMHANDASVGLFMVNNSSCVLVCMIVSLVSLLISHSSSSAHDWNRFQAVQGTSPPPDLAVGRLSEPKIGGGYRNERVRWNLAARHQPMHPDHRHGCINSYQAWFYTRDSPFSHTAIANS